MNFASSSGPCHEVTYNRFHTTAICSPTRASLLTGRNSHHVGTGQITELAAGFPGYTGDWVVRRKTLPCKATYQQTSRTSLLVNEVAQLERGVTEESSPSLPPPWQRSCPAMATTLRPSVSGTTRQSTTSSSPGRLINIPLVWVSATSTVSCEANLYT